MRIAALVALLCVGVGASAVESEYNALKDTLATASVHTVRLSELSSRLESSKLGSGPMKQVGDLCYKQMREISLELDDLDTTHRRFRQNCLSTMARYRSRISYYNRLISKADASSARFSDRWNKLRPRIPPIRHRREKLLRQIERLEGQLLKERAKREATKKIFDRDMKDFAAALKDIDELKKILHGSDLANRQTSANVAKQGFLQVVDQVQSDKLRQMTHRLALAADFLEEEHTEDGPSGVDKILNLLYKIRNEMWQEMDKLSQAEAVSIAQHKRTVLKMRRDINRRHSVRATLYIQIGHLLSAIGSHMTSEAHQRIRSAKNTKSVDKIEIHKAFLSDSCDAEPPMYQKSRSTKVAEIETIKKMLKILRRLNWSGSVYNAISRISVANVDENPESGFVLGFQMSVHDGLAANNYAIDNRNIKNFGRVAIKLEIGTSWVWASFDAFTSNAHRYKIPTSRNGIVSQRYINNLRVHGSPSSGVESVSVAKGNIEMWWSSYKKKNSKKIPGADDGAYDFGDDRSLGRTPYGCFQIHNYQDKQTILAVNNLYRKGQHDVGIGNQKGGRKAQDRPDWTGAHNSGLLKKSKQAVTISWYFQPKGYVDKSNKKKK